MCDLPIYILDVTQDSHEDLEFPVGIKRVKLTCNNSGFIRLSDEKVIKSRVFIKDIENNTVFNLLNR